MLKHSYFDHLMQSRLTGKDPDEEIEGKRRRGVAEDEMVG